MFFIFFGFFGFTCLIFLGQLVVYFFSSNRRLRHQKNNVIIIKSKCALNPGKFQILILKFRKKIIKCTFFYFNFANYLIIINLLK